MEFLHYDIFVWLQQSTSVVDFNIVVCWNNCLVLFVGVLLNSVWYYLVSSIICVAFSSTSVTSYCSECVSCWIYCYFLKNLITWKHSSRLFVMLYRRLLPNILLRSKHCAKNTLLCYTVLHASEIWGSWERWLWRLLFSGMWHLVV